MTNPIIKPTIGRRVWFRPSAAFLERNPTVTQMGSTQPMDAGIVYIHHDNMVNLSVCDHVGRTHMVPSVPLLSGQWDSADDDYAVCEWMPYQKGQAAKSAVPEKDAPIAPTAADSDSDSLEREIQAKASSGPRVTPADIEAEIVSEHYFTAEDGFIGAAAVKHRKVNVVMSIVSYDADKVQSLNLLTFCVLVLRNGFKVTGESACASPANFDAEIGRKIARENAINKVWPLLGFRLRDELARPVLTEADALADLAGTPRPDAPSA